jgi:thiol-disulfide isomerase/thioredoxin
MRDKLLEILKEDWLTITIVLVIVAAYLILRTPGDAFESVAAFEAKLTDGQPTVVEFYSNTCSICLASKPKVDQMERDLSDQASVLRLNVRTSPGDQLAYRWQVTGVPTFFVFDGQGESVYRRAGAPDVAAITEVVESIAQHTD